MPNIDNVLAHAIVPAMATYHSFRENFLRIVAVLGLIAILLLGAWGIIQLAFYLPTFFSNWGRAKETLSVTVPAQTTSDKGFNVSWKHAGKKDASYSYSVSYSCAKGLTFAAPVPTGAYQLVQCNTPFNYVGASSTMPVVPVLAAGTNQATTTLTVAATNLEDGTVAVRGTANTTVGASTTLATATSTTKPAATKPAASKPTSTYVPSGRTQNLYGYADLAVQVTQAPQAVSAGQRVSLQFVVTNIGTNVARSGWMFMASLPYNPTYNFPSGGQQALYPGDKIVYTLGYDAVRAYDYYGQAQATIQVDSNNIVPETSEANNITSVGYQVY